MVKCKSCSQGLCKQSYEYRYMCDNRSRCTCTCQEDAGDTFAKGFLSFVGGAAALVGGIALTVTTGGLGAVGIAAVVGGGALSSVGFTAAAQPVMKKFSGERMTGEEYTKDLIISGAVGAFTGPISAAGAGATRVIASEFGKEIGTQGLVKLGCRTVVGAVAGATGSGVREAGVNGSVSIGSIIKGAIVGAATGGAGHMTGNLAKEFNDNVVAYNVTKVGADIYTTALIDATVQSAETGDVNVPKMAVKVAEKGARSAGNEAFKEHKK